MQVSYQVRIRLLVGSRQPALSTAFAIRVQVSVYVLRDISRIDVLK